MISDEAGERPAAMSPRNTKRRPDAKPRATWDSVRVAAQEVRGVLRMEAASTARAAVTATGAPGTGAAADSEGGTESLTAGSLTVRFSKNTAGESSELGEAAAWPSPDTDWVSGVAAAGVSSSAQSGGGVGGVKVRIFIV
jgi:hypothetical protein